MQSLPTRSSSVAAIGALAAVLALIGCSPAQHHSAGAAAVTSTGSSGSRGATAVQSGGARASVSVSVSASAHSSATSPAATSGTAASEPAGQFTISFAGDVHFAGRTAARLAADPATAFGPSAAVLSRADLTMVNLETAIAVGGAPQSKSFTFEAPPSAFTALHAAGIDLATMANNHGADYGASGLRQSLAAIKHTGFPVVGIGANAAAAYRPYRTTVNGVAVSVLAASQVQDETLANFTAGPAVAGIANAYSPELLSAVRAAKARGDVVIVYVHWGTEYDSCPNADQRSLADQLAAAGATAVVGTHAHVLQGAGWRPDGHYVAFGLGNYFWWRSFGNAQDDNGVLTLTVAHGRVSAAAFAPSHLDERGIGVPAVGTQRSRILSEWSSLRGCTGLLAAPPK
ncbi:CapA family protein [Jatrophihabitans telluris]|uniref:CapA family protein n=1 Tax=Jatrophihabitans telluris TaxID=2038343 RepID=A0ABY4QSQ9_9ACTN|nr:CapA family protein [Jatrophihabitans telluris]UQX86838.1 CapA family protein [Jatrophihabitans telluris]